MFMFMYAALDNGLLRYYPLTDGHKTQRGDMCTVVSESHTHTSVVYTRG